MNNLPIVSKEKLYKFTLLKFSWFVHKHMSMELIYIK
jgi:hypothetical protein